MLKKISGLALCALLLTAVGAKAQVFALKTDVLNWAAASLNIEPEVRVGKKSTVGLAVSWNPWTVKESTKNRKMKHLMVQPEYRWWPCEAFGGHFVGVHAFYSRFNAGNVDLPFGILFGRVVAFIVEFFALAQGDFQFHPGAPEINGEGNEGQALLLDLAKEVVDLPLVHQQAAGAHGVLIEDIALGIGADVHLLDPQLAVLDLHIAVGE